MLAKRPNKAVPVRWERTEDGHRLVRAAGLGRYFPFLFAGPVLTLAAVYFVAIAPDTLGKKIVTGSSR